MADEEELIATISGPALSMLLYENARIHDQVGFLLGEVVVYVTKQVTDSDRDVENVKQHINIKNVVSYPIGQPFFNTIGQVNKDQLRSFLGRNVNKVVGWYHYREQYRLVSSSRDGIMHQDLSAFFDKTIKLVSEENFIFCLLTNSLSDNGGTHKFKQLFLRRKDEKFHPVNLKINNLGADASRPDGSDYKPVPQLSSCDSDAFDLVYQAVKRDSQRTFGVQSVTSIQKAAEHMLSDLIPKVTETDRLVTELEDILLYLRNEYYRKKYERSQLAEEMRKMEVEQIKTEVKVEDVNMEEPLEVSSPNIFDSPKVHNDTKTPTKSTIKKEEDSLQEESNNNPQKASEAPAKSPTLSATKNQRHVGDQLTAKTTRSTPGTGRGTYLQYFQDNNPGRS